MSEKRKYERYKCQLKTIFQYAVGDPNTITLDSEDKVNGAGIILDISCGGMFLITNEKVPASMPIAVAVKDPNNMIPGHIVRTGLLENNPSEVAKKYAGFAEYGDSYIAIEFNTPLDSIDKYITKE